MHYPTVLYTKDNLGKIRLWEISNQENRIIVRHGVHGGKLQTKIETVLQGKAGRSIQEQIALQIQSKINIHLDRGYVSSILEAEKGPTNQLNLPKPMLAQRFDKVKNVDYENAIIQRKYDGNRCIITKQNNKYICYSRNGKIIPANLSHITDELNIPEGWLLDGELYCHGETLQTIVSWIKRDQENTKRLKYHIYDLINDETYGDRINQLRNTIINTTHSEIAPTYSLNTPDELNIYHKLFLSEGYEGTIIRLDGTGYETGKRSKNLIKLKSFLDDEFKIINIHASKDNWGILECITPQGDSFKVTAPGSIQEKTEILNNAQDYINRYINIEYAALTKDQIPFHPIATGFRNTPN